MKTLTSMTDFVLDLEETESRGKGTLDSAINYAKFLKQPLAIYQFVPCELVDGKWVVLEEPHREDYDMYDDTVFMIRLNEYQEALDKVLFEGFKYDFEKKCFSNKFTVLEQETILSRTIEDLVNYDIQLTKTALKEIGL